MVGLLAVFVCLLRAVEMISSIMNTGVNGMLRSSQSMQQSASDIARAGTVDKEATGVESLIEPMIKLKQEQQVFDASAKVVQAGSDMVGTILDIKA